MHQHCKVILAVRSGRSLLLANELQATLNCLSRLSCPDRMSEGEMTIYDDGSLIFPLQLPVGHCPDGHGIG